MTLFILLAICFLFIGAIAWATTPVDKPSSFTSPAQQQIVPVHFAYWPQVTTSDITTAGPKVKMPFKGRVIKATGIVRAIGGSTVHTDIDVIFKNETQSDAVIATCPAVDTSAIVAGGATVSPVSGAVAELASGDVVRMEIDQTGGSSPTADGIEGILWVERY